MKYLKELPGWNGTRIYEILLPKNFDDFNLKFLVSKCHEIIRFGNPGEFISSSGILQFDYVCDVDFKFSFIDSNELYIDHIALIESRMSVNGRTRLDTYKIVLDSGFIRLTATACNYNILVGPEVTNSMYILP